MELTIDQQLEQAVAEHNQGNLQEAEGLYRAVLQAQPSSAVANHNLGLIAVSMNQSKVALPLFKTALEANPSVELFWLSYIEALIAERQFETAEQLINDSQQKNIASETLQALKKELTSAKEDNISLQAPSDADVQKLMHHYESGQYAEAETLAMVITQEFPSHQFGWKVLGALFGQLDRQSDALKANQIAVQLIPQDPAAHYNLSRTLKELGRLEEAESSCRQSIVLKPDYANAHYNLATSLHEIGRLEEAEESYKQAINLEPNLAEAHSNLGNLLHALGRLEEAEASCREAIALQPDYAEAHNNLGNTLQEQGRLDEAENSFRQAISVKPDLAEAYYNLGITLEESGRLKEAAANYIQAVALKSDYTEALHNLSIVQSYMNNLAAEIISLQNILQMDPNNYGLIAGVNLAICNFLIGDFEDSKKYLLAVARIQEKTSSKFTNEKAYQKYLLALVCWHEEKNIDAYRRKSDKTLYVIGESHSLVSHKLCVQNSDSVMLCKAKLIKGCKQWQLGNPTQNKYKNQFESIFRSLPKSSEVLLAIGEIDCRLDSGIIKHKHKFPEKEIKTIIVTTIENYLTYIVKNNSDSQHSIIIQGVPCPNIDTENCPKEDVTQLIGLIKMFNYELKTKSKEKGFGFLDVHKLTDRGDGFSNSVWHIDNIHLSPEGFLEAWSRYMSDQKYD